MAGCSDFHVKQNFLWRFEFASLFLLEIDLASREKILEILWIVFQKRPMVDNSRHVSKKIKLLMRDHVLARTKATIRSYKENEKYLSVDLSYSY